MKLLWWNTSVCQLSDWLCITIYWNRLRFYRHHWSQLYCHATMHFDHDIERWQSHFRFSYRWLCCAPPNPLSKVFRIILKSFPYASLNTHTINLINCIRCIIIDSLVIYHNAKIIINLSWVSRLYIHSTNARATHAQRQSKSMQFTHPPENRAPI